MSYTISEIEGIGEARSTKLAEVNAARNLVRSVPSEAVVAKWIEHAKSLEPRTEH